MSSLLFNLEDYKHITDREFSDGLSLEEWNSVHPGREDPRLGNNTARRAVIKKRGQVCEQCGSTENIQVHHIKRVADGGDHSENNLVVLCRRCHIQAHPNGTKNP